MPNSENPPTLDQLDMEISNVRSSNHDELERELEGNEEQPPIQEDRIVRMEQNFNNIQTLLNQLITRKESENRNDPGPSNRAEPFYNTGRRMVNQTRQNSRIIFNNILERITQIRNRQNASGHVCIVKDEPCARYDDPNALHLVFQVAIFHENTTLLSIGLTEQCLSIRLFIIKKIENDLVSNCQLCRWTLTLGDNRTVELIAYCSINFTTFQERGRQQSYKPVTQIQEIGGREQKTCIVHHLIPIENNNEGDNRKRSRR
jgi:hypothetical protein